MAEQNSKKPMIQPQPNADQTGNMDDNPDMPANNLGESIGGEHSQASVRRVGQDEGKGSQGFGNE
jgi:hypothetical protein